MRKILIIVGANGELGKGISEFLIDKEFNEIILCDFNFDFNYSNAKQIIISDLSIEENALEIFNKIHTDKDTALFLFSTVGGFYGGPKIWETDKSILDDMIKMNFITNFNIAKHFSLLVSKSKFGVCGFTSAYTANNPAENKFAYGVSKSSLSYLIKTLSIEGEKINLSVFGIAPFILDTNANRKWMQDADFSKWIKPIEVGKLIYSLFENYKIISGNILELKIRLDI
jgi:NAD(P)-dependent dehydrogenase (short-subunit alcohol dehydrogenase family)